MLCYSTALNPKLRKYLGFWRDRSTTSQTLTIRRIQEVVRAKNLEATLLFVDFSKEFNSIHRRKMEQILLTYGLPLKNVAAIMVLYKNTKVKVCSPDENTNLFDIVTGVLFIICQDYVLRTSIDLMKENGFRLTKERSRKYPAQTIADTDYINDIALLANTLARAESLLHSLERSAGGIGLHVNAEKQSSYALITEATSTH